MAVEEDIGRVRDFFAHISVAGIDERNGKA